MIAGIGCDITHTQRFLKIIPTFKKSMSQHILSKEEYDELRTKDANDEQISHFLAKRFAAKEALVKALGTGFIDGIYMKDITVRHDDYGCPYFYLENTVLQKLLEKVNQQDFKIHLSISDDAQTALAYVIIEIL